MSATSNKSRDSRSTTGRSKGGC
jgi:hypothetical protein